MHLCRCNAPIFKFFLLVQVAISCSAPRGDNIPRFEATTIDGKYFTPDEINIRGKVLFVIFDPFCEQCRDEIEQLLPYIVKSTETQFVFATLASSDLVLPFIRELGIDARQNTTVLLLTDPYLFVYYGITSPPACYFYNNNKMKYSCCDLNKFDNIIRML